MLQKDLRLNANIDTASLMMITERWPSAVWETSGDAEEMLLTLIPQMVDPDKLEMYIGWLRDNLIATTTRPWSVESKLLDFDERRIWSSSSVEKDLQDKVITDDEAKWRRQYGTLETARLCSQFVTTEKGLDQELDELWGRADAKDHGTEPTWRAEQTSKLRECLGNPFFDF